MNTTLTLVDLGGAIALLIWGVHMVKTGITRAFGPQLRRVLSYALGNRVKAFLAGVGVTSILQSSTATGLMVTSAPRANGLQPRRRPEALRLNVESRSCRLQPSCQEEADHSVGR